MELTIQRSETRNAPLSPCPARTRIQVLCNPDAKTKRPHKKNRHHGKERREVSSLSSIDSGSNYGSYIVSFSEARDSVGSTHSSESESDIERLSSYK